MAANTLRAKTLITTPPGGHRRGVHLSLLSSQLLYDQGVPLPVLLLPSLVFFFQGDYSINSVAHVFIPVRLLCYLVARPTSSKKSIRFFSCSLPPNRRYAELLPFPPTTATVLTSAIAPDRYPQGQSGWLSAITMGKLWKALCLNNET